MSRAGQLQSCVATQASRLGGSRSAFTLIEVVVVLGLLIILTGTMFLTLAAGLRLDQAAANDYDWANSLTDLAETFREDAAASRDLPAQLGQFHADDTTLPLVPVGGTPVVYHWDGRALTRTRLPGGDTPPYRGVVALPERVSSVRFERGANRGRATVRLVLQLRVGPFGHERLDRHEIVAAVGAELR